MNNKILYLFVICFICFNSANALLKTKISPKGKVMLIRHAEKPASGNDLSAMGWRRAECIRDLFTTNTTLTPKKIYAQKASKKNDETIPDSRRQIETVAPLARKLSLTIDNRFTSFEIDELCQDISGLEESDFPVLISWNHEDIKNFLINLGMKYQIAPTYPSKRYDLIFNIETDINGEVVFSSQSQNCEGLGDYRFINGANSIAKHWVSRALVIASAILAIFLF
ncbi:hypothetical protein BCR36DRAFT_282050 [Piromyces finnis]|uniref:Phosphoglycerate mutase-like protein n=1 Tax=Piromyces finnis TaxID=1754191 RepID=A0A1Y1VI29_9FUNG|nr:hypothetical protein BCR36DRAFT_282050 [Piromyces finnis]|eukprot:ORX55441.1 hypothetical protein BCR36DRAFT_282050 [Piromyces finnis]